MSRKREAFNKVKQGLSQADVTKLMSKLRVAIPVQHRRLRNVDGPEGRLLKLRKTVTGLVKYERIELNYERAHEARGYVELLISEAIRHGDCHRATMEMADHWLLEKQLVHKLFKVLAPRFTDMPLSYTRMYKAPREYPGPVTESKRAILELRGNPYPSVKPDTSQNRGFIHNVLLDEAKKQYRLDKYAEIAAKLTSGDGKAALNESMVAGSESGITDSVVSEQIDKKS